MSKNPKDPAQARARFVEMTGLRNQNEDFSSFDLVPCFASATSDYSVRLDTPGALFWPCAIFLIPSNLTCWCRKGPAAVCSCLVAGLTFLEPKRRPLSCFKYRGTGWYFR